MKKTLLLLAAVIINLLPLSANAENRIDYTDRFEIPELNNSNQKPGKKSAFSTITMKESGISGEVGAPALPVKNFRFLVPVYTGKFKVSAKWPDKPAVSAKLTEKLQPVQKPFTTNEKFIETQLDEKAYSKVYEPNVRVVNDYFIDGSNHIVTVAVSPVMYDPTTGAIAIYDNVALSLSYSDVSESEMPMKPIFTEKPDKNLDLSEIVVNYTKPTKAISFDELIYEERGTYIIITTEELMPAFDELAYWKQIKGYNVIRRTIESIRNDPYLNGGDQTSGIVINDEAGMVRGYLQRCYKSYGRCYVLIGGDNFNTEMPIRFGDGDFNTIRKDFLVPSDLYFADMTGCWDSNQNGVYGEYSDSDGSGDNVNYYGDMFVGRLHCKNAREIDNYTKKLILYECNPGLGSTSYLDKALVVRANDIESHYYYNINSKAAIDNTFSTVTQMFSSIDSNDEVYYGSQVLAEMNKNYGLNIIDGHGQPRKICVYYDEINNKQYSINAQEEYLSHPEQDPIRGLDKLTNNLYPGIFYSHACDTCPPDEHPIGGYSKGQFNMGAAYTTAGKYGGVAYIGNTRAGLYSPSDNKYSPVLDGEFAKLLKNKLKIGDLFNQSRYNCYKNNFYETNYHHIYLTYTLIGDPEMYVWTESPKELQVSDIYGFDGSLFLSNIYGAWITVSDGKTTTECILTPNVSNNVTLKDIDNKTVTITKDGYKPFSKLYGIELSVSDKRTYFVTDGNINQPISVEPGGHLIIRGTGNVVINGNLEIAPGAIVEIISDGNIYLKKGYLYAGGSLLCQCRGSVYNYSNFKIQSGSYFSRKYF